MLYAAIMRFNSLREITASLLAETRKLAHLAISCSTLADTNKRHPEALFEAIYCGQIPFCPFFGQPKP
ncbi:DUF4372 domain-containing protein [uncultured Duncaniella sp.]|uniref:DUF4372 domain-containing protein n=1 Tax=uncultured Duncaniella sp. TaxID=2768039 RepID=UPI0025A9EA75|nr:DUF4372 domain-containing protein [uncultured Duncaniella sp.]